MLLNSQISAHATCFAEKICGPVQSTWGIFLGEDEIRARARIFNTKVARRANIPQGTSVPPGPTSHKGGRCQVKGLGGPSLAISIFISPMDLGPLTWLWRPTCKWP